MAVVMPNDLTYTAEDFFLSFLFLSSFFQFLRSEFDIVCFKIVFHLHPYHFNGMKCTMHNWEAYHSGTNIIHVTQDMQCLYDPLVSS